MKLATNYCTALNRERERESPSLNECLLTGPNLNPDLLSILMKFRQQRVAVMADISKAFLQINVNEMDRDVLHFLWLKERPVPFKELKVVIMRMAYLVVLSFWQQRLNITSESMSTSIQMK